MARDVFHKQVKNALIKDGWHITHAQYPIRISNG
ncbi:MAG: element excision factor XisH family protein [Cyanobacteria bacterium P01_D01_bin.156]